MILTLTPNMILTLTPNMIQTLVAKVIDTNMSHTQSLPEPHHDSARDILDCPEVQGEEQRDCHKVPDEIVGEPVTEQVH